MSKTALKVGIINAGAWGTAIGKILAEKHIPVQMWDFRDDVVNEINANRTNSRYLFGVNLPSGITASTDINSVTDGKDYLLIATPSLYISDIAEKISSVPGIRNGKTKIGILTKGFISTQSKPLLLTEHLEKILPESYKNNLVYISGPSHAEEVARGKLTGLISASENKKNSIRFRNLLQGSTLIVFSSFDVIGVQVSAAVKNIIAIACGMLDALKELSELFGDNTESLLIAAGLNEIQLIGQTMGSAYPETFTFIAGVGDLDVTCRSKYGRNRRFGKEIILDRIIDRYSNLEELIANIDEIGYLPEGVMACKNIKAYSKQKDLWLPISDAVYEILNKEAEPFQAVNNMLNRISGRNKLAKGI